MKRLRARLRLFRRSINLGLAVDRKIADDAVIATVQRISRTAPLMGGGTFFAALILWTGKQPLESTEILWHQYIICANFLISLVSIMAWIGASQIKKRKPSIKIQKLFINSVIVFVLATGLILTLIDHLVITGITPLLICITIVGTFYYLPPKNALVIFSIYFIAIKLTLLFFTQSPAISRTSNVINVLMSVLVGFSLSIVNWQHFRRTKIQEETILKQQVVLTKMAYHDALTKLPNRRFLDELVEREVALVKRGQVQSCLIMCDIDNFKEINDTYGHPAGDVLLLHFSNLLQKKMRGSTTLVRLGGEEFMILAPHTSEEQASNLAERLRRTIEEHEFVIDGHAIYITASFGIAALRGTEGDRDYYHRADKALYIAKKAGKNRVAVGINEIAI